MEILRQAGGYALFGMLVSLGSCVTALWYALRPSERALSFMRPVSLATIFIGVSTFAMGLAMVLKAVAATPPDTLNMSRVYVGLSEALASLFVTFGFLAAAWLLVVVGMLRRRA